MKVMEGVIHFLKVARISYRANRWTCRDPQCLEVGISIDVFRDWISIQIVVVVCALEQGDLILGREDFILNHQK